MRALRSDFLFSSKPVGDNATDFPTFTVPVNDTKAIWVYCAQANHCSSGMVFAVNADTSGTNTFDAFRAKAMGSTSSSVPPNNGGSSPTGTGAPLPTTTNTDAAGRIDAQSIAGLSVVFFTSIFFLL